MMPAVRQVALLACVAIFLAGCVTFERAPVSRLECDPQLAGTWQTVKTERLPRPIRVSATCEMTWPQDDGGTFVTPLRGFALEGARYLVFTAEVADRLLTDMSGDLTRLAQADSVVLVRYRIEGDDVLLWLADPDVALDSAKDGKTKSRRVDEHFTHVEGRRKAIATLLRTRGDALFRADDADGTTRFKRIDEESAP